MIVNNLEMTFAKNMSHNFQIIASATRQWQHLNGTWNPTDPARFVQPDAFPNNRDLSQQLFGNGDDNTLNGGGRESGVAYRPFSVRIGGQWLAPWGISVGGSYVDPVRRLPRPGHHQLDATDPQVTRFGPATSGWPTARRSPIRWRRRLRRFHAAVRRESERATVKPQRRRQVPAVEDRPRVQVRQPVLEPAVNLFNVFNTPANTQWGTDANLTYSPSYLNRFNRHPPRALQLSIAYKFSRLTAEHWGCGAGRRGPPAQRAAV